MTDYAELCERLKSREHVVKANTIVDGKPINPDGREAAAAIERLSAALERIAGGFTEVRAPHRVTAMRDFARTILKGADHD